MSISPRRQLSTRVGRSRTHFRLFLLATMLTLVSACANTAKQDQDIKQRAQARWDALVAGDYDTAYNYYSPGYRSSTSRVDFEIAMRVRRVRWTSAEVLESSCTADVCSVETKLGYKVARPVPGISEWKNATDITERWVRTDGQWWFLPEE